MAISSEREKLYQKEGEDICCYECTEPLEPDEVFTCDECQEDFCKDHHKNHEC